ncbi:hypothetical protein AB4Z09_16565 [Rhodococcus sp. TAF43]|uniref:hypothetical protein n=1 Tax=unclassified Rhodococcus (in: high G+C Gram-positive bacteria) TaxID=192944 RepID=UPI001583CA8C|nr:hypothetical protein [Rhodococcus sp. W8901]QKT10554.1 hypothetical protein HUN07_07340 [Rhodococcus sp. W8901]
MIRPAAIAGGVFAVNLVARSIISRSFTVACTGRDYPSSNSAPTGDRAAGAGPLCVDVDFAPLRPTGKPKGPHLGLSSQFAGGEELIRSGIPQARGSGKQVE